MSAWKPKGLSRAELIDQAFECCQQCVRSYGPGDISLAARVALVNAMEHFKQLALRDIAKEND